MSTRRTPRHATAALAPPEEPSDDDDFDGEQPTTWAYEPAFFPFKLSGEQYAAILRDPVRHGYPILPPHVANKPKHGQIYVELRSPTARRPKLVDGFDWVPSSTANASFQVLADGQTKLMRYYCARRTKWRAQ